MCFLPSRSNPEFEIVLLSQLITLYRISQPGPARRVSTEEMPIDQSEKISEIRTVCCDAAPAHKTLSALGKTRASAIPSACTPPVGPSHYAWENVVHPRQLPSGHAGIQHPCSVPFYQFGNTVFQKALLREGGTGPKNPRFLEPFCSLYQHSLDLPFNQVHIITQIFAKYTLRWQNNTIYSWPPRAILQISYM